MRILPQIHLTGNSFDVLMMWPVVDLIEIVSSIQQTSYTGTVRQRNIATVSMFALQPLISVWFEMNYCSMDTLFGVQWSRPNGLKRQPKEWIETDKWLVGSWGRGAKGKVWKWYRDTILYRHQLIACRKRYRLYHFKHQFQIASANLNTSKW